LGSSPEALLARDWIDRAGVIGRAHGLGPVDLIEVEGRKPGKGAEAEALSARIDTTDYVIACDEKGEALSSRRLTEILVQQRDDGLRRLVFVVGGADGLEDRFRQKADRRIAFGPQTWPHALVRAMLAEQVYRATTLVAGTPYHRD
jgi:23S rRNA (pseudouridine1915-N3)-methyltransferase